MNYHQLIVKIYSIKTKVKFVMWLKGEGEESESDLSRVVPILLFLHYPLLLFSLQCQVILLFNCLLVFYPITYHHFSCINI